MGVEPNIFPDIFNPDGSLNEEVLNERSRRIGARMAGKTGIPGVDAMYRKHRNQRIKFALNWLFRAAVVVGLICIVVELKK